MTPPPSGPGLRSGGRRGPEVPGGLLRPALLSGVLLFLSFPPFPFPLLGFVALAPLALALEGLPSGPEGRWPALFLGIGSGAVSWALLLHWVPFALLPVTPLAAFPLGILLVAVLAVLTGACLLAAHELRRGGTPVLLALPLSWTALEWTRGNLGALAFPWLPLGTALAPVPALAAPAEVVGVHGLSLWMAVTASGAAAWASGGGRRGREGRGLLPAGVLLLVLLPASWGAWRVDSLALEPVATVAAVQLQLPGDPRRPSDPRAVAPALVRLLDRLEPGAVDLVLLPEAAVDAVVGRGEADPEPLPTLRRQAARLGAPLLAGGYLPVPGRPGSAVNGVLAVDPEGGVEEVHGKRYLVPAVERALPPPLDRIPGGNPGGLVPGPGAGRVGVAAAEGAPLVCWEVAFPRAVQRPRREGAAVLLVLTHEGWFGPPGPGSTIPRAHHIAHLQLRAVEGRMGTVRSAFSGEALLVDPAGRITHRGEGSPDTVLTGPLHTMTAPPLFVRTGDLAGSGALAGVLLLLARGAVRRRSGVPGGLGTGPAGSSGLA